MTASTPFDNAAAPVGDPRLDARVRRTRDALLEALFLEMTDRGYERTTVQHLLARAGVGRATFYAHFDGKEALLAASLQRLQDMLERADRAGRGRLAFTAAFFEHLDSHRRLYRTLVLRESEVTVEARIREMLRVLVRRSLQREPGRWDDPAWLELATQYVAGTLWSVLGWWMEGRVALTPQGVDEAFRRLVSPGLDALAAGLAPGSRR